MANLSPLLQSWVIPVSHYFPEQKLFVPHWALWHGRWQEGREGRLGGFPARRAPNIYSAPGAAEGGGRHLSSSSAGGFQGILCTLTWIGQLASQRGLPLPKHLTMSLLCTAGDRKLVCAGCSACDLRSLSQAGRRYDMG